MDHPKRRLPSLRVLLHVLRYAGRAPSACVDVIHSLPSVSSDGCARNRCGNHPSISVIHIFRAGNRLQSDPDEVTSPSEGSGFWCRPGFVSGARRSLLRRGTRDWAECRLKGEITSATAARNSATKLCPCFPAARCRRGFQQGRSLLVPTVVLQGIRPIGTQHSRESGGLGIALLVVQCSSLTKRHAVRIPGLGRGSKVGSWTFAEVPYCREQAGIVRRDSPSDHALYSHCGGFCVRGVEQQRFPSPGCDTGSFSNDTGSLRLMTCADEKMHFLSPDFACHFVTD